MSSEHTISIAAASRGGSRPASDGAVSVPVDELMASNGLVTGQSGADPAASARRVAESLLDAGETVFVVDPDGDFDALANDAAVLHVGGDRDCDVQVRPSSVDRVASLALDGSTSVLLDLSSFDAGAGDDLLGGLTDELVQAGRERPTDLLLVVGECHRWLAESGPTTRTGENLVQLGGRRHDGVGIVGVTDQPADVRDDVLTGVDWLLAHRLTWREDVRALERLLDRQYTEQLEDLDDEEAFFNAGWERGVERLDFAANPDRREPSVTNDSPAPDEGLLADVPAARSPNGSDASQPDEPANDLAKLRDDLAGIDDRLAALEDELDARADVEEMADRIAESITESLRDADADPRSVPVDSGDAADRPTDAAPRNEANTNERKDVAADDAGADDTGADDDQGGFGDVFGMFDDNDTVETTDASDQSSPDAGATASGPSTVDEESTAKGDTESPAVDGPGTGSSDVANGSPSSDRSSESSKATDGNDDGGMSFKPIDFGFDEPAQDLDSTVPDDFGSPSRRSSSGRSIPRYLRKIVRSIEEMDATTRKMLAYYVDQGTESPMDAHISAGGGGDRTRAYAYNRQLRTNGLIEHVGKGKYAPRLREYVVDQAGHSVPEHELDRAVRIIERTVDAA